ncbi:unnamed protein product [Owenia fusiformis]|uniref:Uncharacterized protein n=1 Tax=Owenia fusiformis TaxID=6347 RepID=A0A8J1U014_OWEFU|nr:unnamed protein product [Owenia fusiformis]
MPTAFSLRHAGCYSIYVLFLLLFAYLLNQLDRYTLPIVTKPMAQELHYGDKVCMQNSSAGSDVQCTNKTVESEQQCVKLTNINGTHVCEWNYNGQGIEYQVIAGPIFIVIYTFMGIFLGIAADHLNRKNLLAGCLVFWSIMTLVTGFSSEFWHLAVLRFGLGIGEAGCTPFATSIIADYFPPELRGAALGVYNWGIYTGYSMSFALGNLIIDANILGQGWRWVFFISGIPGIILGAVIFFTLKEPERTGQKQNETKYVDVPLSWKEKIAFIVKPFIRPSLLLLCLAGSIRNAGGYVWAYNTQPYFESIHQTRDQIAKFMSWIPLIGGSLGAVLGGFISDRVVTRRGPTARIMVLVISQLVAAPFAAGALFLNPPWCYISLIPANIVGEMWVGVTLAVVIELVPWSVRTGAIAFYLFIISNIGGNVPLLVPPIQKAFQNLGYTYTPALRGALYILYPGLYVLSALLFLVTLCVIKRDIRKAQEEGKDYVPVVEETEGET